MVLEKIFQLLEQVVLDHLNVMQALLQTMQFLKVQLNGCQKITHTDRNSSRPKVFLEYKGTTFQKQRGTNKAYSN